MKRSARIRNINRIKYRLEREGFFLSANFDLSSVLFLFEPLLCIYSLLLLMNYFYVIF